MAAQADFMIERNGAWHSFSVGLVRAAEAGADDMVTTKSIYLDI